MSGQAVYSVRTWHRYITDSHQVIGVNIVLKASEHKFTAKQTVTPAHNEMHIYVIKFQIGKTHSIIQIDGCHDKLLVLYWPIIHVPDWISLQSS